MSHPGASCWLFMEDSTSPDLVTLPVSHRERHDLPMVALGAGPRLSSPAQTPAPVATAVPGLSRQHCGGVQGVASGQPAALQAHSPLEGLSVQLLLLHPSHESSRFSPGEKEHVTRSPPGPGSHCPSERGMPMGLGGAPEGIWEGI